MSEQRVSAGNILLLITFGSGKPFDAYNVSCYVHIIHR
jgi:hypothetical protein